MPKDTRITVRMSEELGAWVHEQAMLGEQDDAAFVRMVLSNLRRGVTAAPVAAVAAPAPPAVRRDVLDVASGVAYGPDVSIDEAFADELPQGSVLAIDLDDLVNATLASADAQGLTQVLPQEAVIPPSGVRAVMRPAVPFSRQPGHIPA